MTDEKQRPTDDIPNLTDTSGLGPGPRGEGGEGTGTYDLGSASPSGSDETQQRVTGAGSAGDREEPGEAAEGDRGPIPG